LLGAPSVITGAPNNFLKFPKCLCCSFSLSVSSVNSVIVNSVTSSFKMAQCCHLCILSFFSVSGAQCFLILFVSVKVKVEVAAVFDVAVVVSGGIRGTQCWVRSGVLRFTRIKLICKEFTDQLHPHVYFIVADQV